ncbi:MAG: hypothetical protein IT210_08175 [Armatimonadetes bacterium]|nr:hypothetical protein [Armatimonadota bacterium]
MNRNKVLWMIVLIGVAASLLVAGQRMQQERTSRAVEIIVEWAEMRDMAALAGMNDSEALAALKNAGVIGIAVDEMTVAEYRSGGRIIPTERPALSLPAGPFAFALVSDEPLLEAIAARIPARLKSPASAKGGVVFYTRSGKTAVMPGLSLLEVNDISLGLPAEEIAAVRGTGLDVVARLRNDNGLTSGAIRQEMAGLKSARIYHVIFSGDQVLGYRKLLKEAASALAANNITFVSIEFGKQKGTEGLERSLQGFFVRLHSITRPEMAAITPPEAVERFSRAVKERNIRICYLRLFQMADENIVRMNLNYIARLRDALIKSGYEMNIAAPAPNRDPSSLLHLLAGIGVVAGALLLLTALASISNTWLGVLSGAGVLMAIAASLMPGSLGLRALALLAALSFPILALVRYPTHRAEAEGCQKPFWSIALSHYLMISATSLLGALLIVGLLSRQEFMMKVSQFSGIKLAHALPLLFLALLYIVDGFPYGETWREQKRRVWDNLQKLWERPVLIGQVAFFLAATVILLFIVMRTGNDAGVGVSPLELKFRAILDRVLIVRPRTKEFLFGHPVLIAGLALAALGRRRWGTPLVVLAAIGQMSMINTFCHIHTPLAISAIRTANGLLWGGLIGLFLSALIGRFAVRQEEAVAAGEPAAEARSG